LTFLCTPSTPNFFLPPIQTYCISKCIEKLYHQKHLRIWNGGSSKLWLLGLCNYDHLGASLDQLQEYKFQSLIREPFNEYSLCISLMSQIDSSFFVHYTLRAYHNFPYVKELIRKVSYMVFGEPYVTMVTLVHA
jgi:hypothetical protein